MARKRKTTEKFKGLHVRESVFKRISEIAKQERRKVCDTVELAFDQYRPAIPPARQTEQCSPEPALSGN